DFAGGPHLLQADYRAAAGGDSGLLGRVLDEVVSAGAVARFGALPGSGQARQALHTAARPGRSAGGAGPLHGGAESAAARPHGAEPAVLPGSAGSRRAL